MNCFWYDVDALMVSTFDGRHSTSTARADTLTDASPCLIAASIVGSLDEPGDIEPDSVTRLLTRCFNEQLELTLQPLLREPLLPPPPSRRSPRRGGRDGRRSELGASWLFSTG